MSIIVTTLPNGLGKSIQELMKPSNDEKKTYDTATFYSISNCQEGLSRVTLGNFLIKRVVYEIQEELPHIKNFGTLSPIPGFADWFIIATASSSRNAKAISNKIIEEVKLNKLHVIGVEGQEDSEWVLIDCGDIVINVMQQEAREFYDLESLWGEKTLILA